MQVRIGQSPLLVVLGVKAKVLLFPEGNNVRPKFSLECAITHPNTNSVIFGDLAGTKPGVKKLHLFVFYIKNSLNLGNLYTTIEPRSVHLAKWTYM